MSCHNKSCCHEKKNNLSGQKHCGLGHPSLEGVVPSGATTGDAYALMGGATLLLDHWFSLSPAVSGFVLNLLCYGWGWRLLACTMGSHRGEPARS